MGLGLGVRVGAGGGARRRLPEPSDAVGADDVVRSHDARELGIVDLAW